MLHKSTECHNAPMAGHLQETAGTSTTPSPQAEPLAELDGDLGGALQSILESRQETAQAEAEKFLGKYRPNYQSVRVEIDQQPGSSGAFVNGEHCQIILGPQTFSLPGQNSIESLTFDGFGLKHEAAHCSDDRFIPERNELAQESADARRQRQELRSSSDTPAEALSASRETLQDALAQEYAAEAKVENFAETLALADEISINHSQSPVSARELIETVASARETIKIDSGVSSPLADRHGIQLPQIREYETIPPALRNFAGQSDEFFQELASSTPLDRKAMVTDFIESQEAQFAAHGQSRAQEEIEFNDALQEALRKEWNELLQEKE